MDGPSWAREDGDRLRLVSGDPFSGTTDGRATVGREEARLLPPVAPSKIVAIGLNYKDHAAERNKPVPKEPLIFLKPPSSVIGPGATIEIPSWAGHADAESHTGHQRPEYDRWYRSGGDDSFPYTRQRLRSVVAGARPPADRAGCGA